MLWDHEEKTEKGMVTVRNSFSNFEHQTTGLRMHLWSHSFCAFSALCVGDGLCILMYHLYYLNEKIYQVTYRLFKVLYVVEKKILSSWDVILYVLTPSRFTGCIILDYRCWALSFNYLQLTFAVCMRPCNRVAKRP